MARTSISRTALPTTGIDVTDATNFETMSTGSGNGVTFTFGEHDLLVLNNVTGVTATYSVIAPVPSKYSTWSVTFGTADIALAAGEVWIVPMSSIFHNSTSGIVAIDCDQAADIMVLTQ